ncbi:MAG: lipoyl(octanoyl) transferase LipB [Chitinophagaceae bacterium]|nr:lipoyl(octanoyl) transferase LipB [Chitinophagaceae bacterium]
MNQVLFKDLGEKLPYKKVWDYQEQLLKQNVTIKAWNREAIATGLAVKVQDGGTIETLTIETRQILNYLLFVEHSPVYTLGKSGDASNILISNEDREAKGIDFFKINRGGDITFHGPGQLVGYPILDLEAFRTDLGWYLRSLEEVIILTMKEYGLNGMRSSGETGVWLDADIPGKERKICAMGIRCSRWITMHGLAFNINTDLNYFSYIIPCGIVNKQVTSLQKELGRGVSMKEVKEKVKRNFQLVFDALLQDWA